MGKDRQMSQEPRRESFYPTPPKGFTYLHDLRVWTFGLMVGGATGMLATIFTMAFAINWKFVCEIGILFP